MCETQQIKRETGRAAQGPGHRGEMGCPANRQVMPATLTLRRLLGGPRKEERGENKYIDFQMVEWVEKGRKIEKLKINNS